MAVILHGNSSGIYSNETLIEHIRHKNNAEVLSILQNVDPRQLTDSSGNTLLHYSARFGNDVIVQRLLDLGTAVDVQNRKQHTPLFFAASYGEKDTARLLVEANANVLLPANSGQCPLGVAFKCDESIANVLLDGVTVDSLKKNIEYVTSEKFHLDCPLYRFVPLKNAGITRLLLECGSPVNVKYDWHFVTPLHLAAGQLDLKNVKVLLEFNADVNAKSRNGDTPLARVRIEGDFGCSKERDEAESRALAIVKALIAAGAVLAENAPQRLMPRWLLMHGNREMVRAILQGPIDLKFEDEFEETVLHVLAYNKCLDVLGEVQDLESASKVRSVKGYTMLHKAAGRGNANAIKHLLNSGADVNVEDNDRETPLSWVYDSYRFYDGDRFLDDYLDCIDILLEHGANPRPKSSSWENESFGKMLDLMKKRIAEMKQIVIGESVTLFDFFIASDEEMSSYARNKRSITKNLADKLEERDFDTYYNRRLQTRYVKFSQLAEARETLTVLIEKFFIKFYNTSQYTVAEKIVKYLNDEELCKI